MEKINFAMTWCDYLTKCPHLKGVEVGSYDCAFCRYKVEDEHPTIRTGDYMSIKTGYVVCKYEDEKKEGRDLN